MPAPFSPLRLPPGNRRYAQGRLIFIIRFQLNLTTHGRSALLTIRLCLQILFGAALLLSAALSLPAAAQGARVGVVVSGDAPYFTLTYQQMTRRVLAELPDIRFVLLNASSLPDYPERADLDLIVTIGSDAARSALAHTVEAPLLATFLSRANYEALLARPALGSANRRISAIFTDQPPLYRLRLARRLLSEAQVIGTALGPNTSALRDELVEAAAQTDFALRLTAIDMDSNPSRELQPVFGEADAFVVIPDSAQINRASSRWILNLGYRERTPIIGFSQTYTRSGALASLYTSPQDVGRHAGEAIIAWLCCADPQIWQPESSRYFSIDTNAFVADALDIKLPSISELQHAVLEPVMR